MYIEKNVVVEKVMYEDEDIQLLSTSGGAKKAILYTNITPRASTGDTIIVNVTSTELKLGTGGMDIVVSVIGASPLEIIEPPGHIMKARYLPNQHSVLSVEAQESQFHDYFLKDFSLKDKKILIAELHSMVPICYWAMDFLKTNAKIAVIISDEACLPLYLSNHVRALKTDERFITITIGQAFGGTYEAINLPTALQFAAEVLQVDVILVTLGPGVVGSGTKFGFSGIAQANWANTIKSLDGVPVWISRLSEKENRERHYGISHHTLTPLSKFTYSSCKVPLPIFESNIGDYIKNQAKELTNKHQVQWIEKSRCKEIIEHCLEKSPFSIKTMGRSYEDDPLFFYGVVASMIYFFENDC